MQTFLPLPSFSQSAAVLDNRRLNKQCVECLALLTISEKAAGGVRSGYYNHPASRMWRGYELALWRYAEAMFSEYHWRNPQASHDGLSVLDRSCYNQADLQAEYPPWFGDDVFHASHRGRLLMKGQADALQIGIKWAKQKGIEVKFRHKGIRHASLKDFVAIEQQLKEHGIAYPRNYYLQFGWPEEMIETNYWPVPLLGQKTR